MSVVSANFMMDKPKHARDIDDREFLRAVELCKRGSWATRWDVQFYLSGYGTQTDWSVDEEELIVHWKLVIAKAKRLIARGLLDGCTCTCRGDYYLTDKGKEFLNESVVSVPCK